MKFLSSLGSRIVALFAFARFFGWRWLVVLPGLAAVVLSASVAYRDHVQLAEMRSALSAAHVVQVSDSSGHKLGAVLLPQQAGDFWVNQTASTPFAIKDGSGVVRDSFSTTHGLITAGGGGSDVSVTIGPLVGFETTDSGLWMLPNATAATASNYVFDVNSTSVFFNAPSSTINFQLGASTTAAMNGSAFFFGGTASGASPLYVQYSAPTTPLIQAGTNVTSLTLGTDKSGAILALQYGAAVTGLTLGTNGLTPGVGTQAVAGGGTITPSATVLANPYITLTGTLSSGTTTIALPNAVGMWWFDISAVTFGGNTLRFNSGSANSTGITTLVTTTEIVQVFTGGSNTIAINL